MPRSCGFYVVSPSLCLAPESLLTGFYVLLLSGFFPLASKWLLRDFYDLFLSGFFRLASMASGRLLRLVSERLLCLASMSDF